MMSYLSIQVILPAPAAAAACFVLHTDIKHTTSIQVIIIIKKL
jgi:hypothetical protein